MITEFAFTLPRGYVGSDGNVHRRGIMRLATARDEIEPLRDPRVQGADDPYLTIIVLSRVITQLGTLSAVTPREVENLFAADLAFLQDLYGVVNFGSPNDVRAFLAEADQAEREADDRASAPVAAHDVDAELDDDSDDEGDEEIVIAGRRRGGSFIEEVHRD